MWDLIYIQTITCGLIIHTHTHIHKHTHANTLRSMIHAAGSPSACDYWFLFSVIHSLPCTPLVLPFFYLNAFALSWIMTACKRMMPLHAWRLQWRGWQTSWIEFRCLISLSIALFPSVSLSLDFVSPIPWLPQIKHSLYNFKQEHCLHPFKIK